jgi:hypothetical protein
MERLVQFLPSMPLPLAVRYGSSIVLVAMFFVFRLAAGNNAGQYGVIFYILPVLLSSIIFDRGSGFAATACSVLAIGSQVDWQDNPIRHLTVVISFAIVGLVLAASCEALRKALERGIAAQQELQLLLQEQRHRTSSSPRRARPLSSFLGGRPGAQHSQEPAGAHFGHLGALP